MNLYYFLGGLILASPAVAWLAVKSWRWRR